MKSQDFLLWFVHVPRTGGTSIYRYLEKCRYKSYHNGHSRFSCEKENELKATTKKLITFTVMRDPVKHCVSLYTYIKKHKHHTFHKIAANNSFHGWLDKFYEVPNYYTRFFSDFTNMDKNLALQQLGHFDFILNTETLTNDFNSMLSQLGLKKDFNIHINSSKTNLNIAPKDIEHIKHIRKIDYELLSNIKFINR